MNSILSDIAKFFPAVLGGVIAVEQGIAGASGQSKKQVLVTAIDTAAKFGETVGNTEVQLVSTLIDTTVQALNTIGVFKTTPPASTAPVAEPNPAPAPAAPAA